MTIVFLVRSAERYAGKKWRCLCDLSIDSTAAVLEPQVSQSAETLLNYPFTRTFSLVKMLLVHYDWCSFGICYISCFLCCLPPARSAVVAGQWLCWIKLLSTSIPKPMLHTHTQIRTQVGCRHKLCQSIFIPLFLIMKHFPNFQPRL